jgi:protein-tyrosine phosphatase
VAKQQGVLFVCLGNICRSPLAEAAFRSEAERVGLDVETDSAGTGRWHIGEAPDKRAQAVARRHGVDISGYSARQVIPDDFRRFDYVLALDLDNLTALERIRPADSTAKVGLLLDYVEGREGEEVADPYFGGNAGFETTWTDVSAAAQTLVRRIADKG